MCPVTIVTKTLIHPILLLARYFYEFIHYSLGGLLPELLQFLVIYYLMTTIMLRIDMVRKGN